MNHIIHIMSTWPWWMPAVWDLGVFFLPVLVFWPFRSFVEDIGELLFTSVIYTFPTFYLGYILIRIHSGFLGGIFVVLNIVYTGVLALGLPILVVVAISNWRDERKGNTYPIIPGLEKGFTYSNSDNRNE